MPTINYSRPAMKKKTTTMKMMKKMELTVTAMTAIVTRTMIVTTMTMMMMKRPSWRENWKRFDEREQRRRCAGDRNKPRRKNVRIVNKY